MARNRRDRVINVNSTPRQEVTIYPFVERYPKSTAKGDIMKTRKIEITSSIQEISYSKDKASPSGTFYFTIMPTDDWQYIIKPGDWITIHQSQINLNNNTTLGLICLGNVDRVSRTYTVDDEGKKIVRFKVEGRDYGKILEDTKFYYNPYIVGDNNALARTTAANLGVIRLGSPVDLFRTYFNIYYGTGVSLLDKIDKKQPLKELNQLNIPPQVLKIFGVNGAKKFGDIVRIRIGNEHFTLDKFIQQDKKDKENLNVYMPEGFTLKVSPDLVSNYNVWEVLTAVANLTMNELYTSMEYFPMEDKIFPTVTFRKIPFSYNQEQRKDLYTNLPLIQARNWAIKTEDLGFSDHERINYIQLDTESKLHSGFASVLAIIAQSKTPAKYEGIQIEAPSGEIINGVPYIDEASIQRYGVNQYFASTNFCYKAKEGENGKLVEDTKEPNFNLYKRWVEELVAIWSNMERYESGTITLKGFSHKEEPGEKASRAAKKRGYILSDLVTVGENLYLADKKKLFHIEGFTRTWRAPGSQDIQVTVSRGIYWDRRTKKRAFLDEIFTDGQAYRTKLNRIKRKIR